MCELSIIIVLIIISYVSGIGCPVKFFTGISCPGCGMTRAWEAAFSLDFHQAFLLYRKDRLRRSLELKKARTEAGTTNRR